jgi:glycosyltransferase involved in cell wall biosynthesis
MRILICTGIYPPDIGGPATYSKLLVDELPKRGIEVKVLSFGSVRHLPKIIRHFVYFLKVLKLGRSTDIIFAQDPVSVGLPSLMAAKIIQKKFIIRVAGDYAWEQARQRFDVKDSIDEFQDKKYGSRVEFLRLIQKFTANHAHAIITPSIYFKNLVSGWLKNKNKVHAIYNGIKLADIEPKERKENILSLQHKNRKKYSSADWQYAAGQIEPGWRRRWSRNPGKT